jgi:hypothetical protein
MSPIAARSEHYHTTAVLLYRLRLMVGVPRSAGLNVSSWTCGELQDPMTGDPMTGDQEANSELKEAIFPSQSRICVAIA